MKRLLALIAIPVVASAHPMGNFSINHYAAITPGGAEITIQYVIDMAEIPTFQEMQRTGMRPDPEDANARTYILREQETLRQGLIVSLNGHRAVLRGTSRQVIFPVGAGGLPTMKMAFVYRVAINGNSFGPMTLRYSDTNFPDRIGWKEVVVTAGKGAKLSRSSATARDRSHQLTNYPTDLISSPPQELTADVQFVGVPVDSPRIANSAAIPRPQMSAPQASSQRPVSLVANARGTPRNAFTQLVNQRQWGFWFFFTAAFIAAGLGAFHALEPGHGKTMVAAYLIGSRGTAMHACLLGLIVTASHTAGVYILGAIVVYASRYVIPEQLYPWLGAVSGLTIAGLGLYLLFQRWQGKHVHHHHHQHGHSHSPSHQHDHHHHPHLHAHDHHSYAPTHVSKRQLFALGITGGIVPCPAALVVLLSAVALHRVAFGLFLIVAFSIGLAAVLIAVGLMMVYARRFMSRVANDGPVISRWLPITSAIFIAFLGFAIAVRSLTSAGVLKLPV